MGKKKMTCAPDRQVNDQNKWMALSHDKKEVIVEGTSLAQTFKEAKKIGEKSPIMYKIPPKSACLLL